MVSTGRAAQLLKAMAHPVRLRILRELLKGVKCVSDLEEFLSLSQPNVSQHLGLLRAQGIIDYYMDGRLRCYFLVEPVVAELLQVLQKEHYSPLARPSCCPVSKRGKYPQRR